MINFENENGEFFFFLNTNRTLLMLSVVPLLIIGASLFGRYVRKISKQVQDALAKSGEVSSEVIGAIRTVRSFSKDDDESNRYALCVRLSTVVLSSIHTLIVCLLIG